MKVLQLGKHYPFYGGIEKFYYDLAIELNKNNIKCDIFCANESNKSRLIVDNGINIYTYGRFAFKASTSLSYKIFYDLRKLIDHYDILHVHFPDPMIVLALFILNPRKPIVLHWHSDIVKQKNLKKLFLPLQEWILKKADVIIGTSKIYIDSSKDLERYRHKCIAIPSGLNPSRLYVDEGLLKKLKNEYKGKKIIYSFGRMTEYKGFEYLIESAKYLDDKYIILIGGGGDNSKYKEIIDKNDLKGKVKLVGRINDEEVGTYYQLCDVFVLPSVTRNEAFGLVQCEAMYFGKPIISTNIQGSGVSWVNQHNKTGIIIPPKDSKELANAIKLVLNNDELYMMFSENSFNRFHKNFHIKAIANQFINLYKELLNDNSH